MAQRTYSIFGKREVMRASVLGDRTFDEFSGVADGYEQQKAGNELAGALKDAERLRLGECDACRHFLFSLLGRVVAEFVLQGLKPRAS